MMEKLFFSCCQIWKLNFRQIYHSYFLWNKFQQKINTNFDVIFECPKCKYLCWSINSKIFRTKNTMNQTKSQWTIIFQSIQHHIFFYLFFRPLLLNIAELKLKIVFLFMRQEMQNDWKCFICYSCCCCCCCYYLYGYYTYIFAFAVIYIKFRWFYTQNEYIEFDSMNMTRSFHCLLVSRLKFSQVVKCAHRYISLCFAMI